MLLDEHEQGGAANPEDIIAIRDATGTVYGGDLRSIFSQQIADFFIAAVESVCILLLKYTFRILTTGIRLQTIGLLRTFVLAIVTHPDVARKAQEEIDRVVGNERLPELKDRYNMPYISSILKETYRWDLTSSFLSSVVDTGIVGIQLFR